MGPLPPARPQMTHNAATRLEQIADELDVLSALVPLAGQHIVELGCGVAQLARALLTRFPYRELTGIEIDAR